MTLEERARRIGIGGQPAGPEAILKLGGARTTQGVEPLAADLGSESELLAELYQATVDRRVVRFEYRQKRRTLFPHGIGHARGHWYLVGVDPAADGDTRVFRVDRITELDIGREPGSFTRTPDVDVRSALSEHPWETGEEIVEATVRFGPEAAWWARRRLGATGSFDAREDGIEDVTLDVSNAEAFIGWVLSFGEHAEILAPPELREALVRHVREVQV